MKLKKIYDSELTKEQLDLLDKTFELFPDIPKGMTQFQIEQFVLNSSDFPTWYSVYHQCVLELWTRLTSVMDSLDHVKTMELQAEVYEATASELIDDGSRKSKARANLLAHKASILRRRVVFERRELESKIEEMKVFESARKTAEKRGKIKPYGDNEAERIRWYLRFVFQKHQMRRSLVAGYQDGKETLEAVAGELNQMTDGEKRLLGVDNGVVKPMRPTRREFLKETRRE